MGTILKYIFYIALIIIIFLVAKGVYDGRITEDTTVKEVGSNIATGTEKLVSATAKAISDKSDEADQKIDQVEAEHNAEKTAEKVSTPQPQPVAPASQAAVN